MPAAIKRVYPKLSTLNPFERVCCRRLVPPKGSGLGVSGIELQGFRVQRFRVSGLFGPARVATSTRAGLEAATLCVLGILTKTQCH